MTDIKKFLQENSVKFIDFRFTDLVGHTHSVAYNVNKVNIEAGAKISFQEGVELIPDMQTIFCDPFCAQPTAVMLCSSENFHLHDSRSVTKRAYDYLLSTKIVHEAEFGFEIGFSILDEEKLKANVDTLFDLRSETLLMMMEAGIEKPLYHKKISPCQGLVRVSSSSILNGADNIQKSKHIIYSVAHSYGKTATFSSKQNESNNLCLYHSLSKDNDSLFEKSEDYSHYIGGIKKHIRAINAYANSTADSYKGSIELPCFLPQFKQIKIPFSDPFANPYLYLAAILMAGLDGIQNKIDPNKIAIQPACSLNEALDSLDRGREFLLKEKVFTNELIDKYIKIKRKEIKKI
ncbi:MAG: Glutamine synthetase [Wolbachia endosymbiont of Ctenocephalides orientis wCori]|nr:MAG: Glutamine synthetase [Wolbachia endosymbiont of Ctenocephalides orientis wCori]